MKSCVYLWRELFFVCVGFTLIVVFLGSAYLLDLYHPPDPSDPSIYVPYLLVSGPLAYTVVSALYVVVCLSIIPPQAFGDAWLRLVVVEGVMLIPIGCVQWCLVWMLIRLAVRSGYSRGLQKAGRGSSLRTGQK